MKPFHNIRLWLRIRRRPIDIKAIRAKAFGPPMTKDEKREFQRQVAEVKVRDDRKRAGEGGGLF